jgi:glycosyltransferase involved in cell wall biosynthesis
VKIGVDTFACDGGESEVGLYLINILKRLPPSGDLYELFGWDFDRFAYTDAGYGLDFIPQCSVTGESANALWHYFKYPDFAKKRAYNACFFPVAHRRVPMHSPCPTIGTVHEMTTHWVRQKKREQQGHFFRFLLPNALRKLDKAIAVSNWIKQMLIEVVGIRDSVIEVVPQGVDLSLFYPRSSNEESTVLIQPFSFRRPYILYYARIEHPSKNHVRLIEAFGIFKDRTHYPHRLVLAGADSYGAETVKDAASISPYKTDIFFAGAFPQKRMPELYAGADMVVIPSLFEGFGSGVLEAFASGIPVACAQSAGLPEIVGSCGLYFDPKNPADIADRMVTLASNRDIYRECRASGLARAQEFSWERCVQRTLSIIRETIGT